MSKKKILYVVPICAFTVFIFCLCLYFIDNALNQFPCATQLNYNLKSDNLPLTIKDIENLSKRISLNQVCFCAELESATVKGEAVTPVLTNEYYFEIYGQQINGRNITKENTENKDKVAVIGSNLALKLFFTKDAVGKTITLCDEVYTICGVVQDNETIINSISSDGMQRIFIPYTCYSDYENYEVHTISFDNSASSAPLIEQMNLSQYHSTNFYDKAKVIENFKHIIFLILFIALCFILLNLWYRVCKKFINDIKVNLIENYFLKSCKYIPHIYFLFILTALGIPAALITISLFGDFGIYIIPEYIPYDNIFDISYYINIIVENSNNINGIALTGDTILLNLYSGSFNLLVWLISIFFLFFTMLLKRVKIF